MASRHLPEGFLAELEIRRRVSEEVRVRQAAVAQLLSHCPYFEKRFNVQWNELTTWLPAEQLQNPVDAARLWVLMYCMLKHAREIIRAEKAAGKVLRQAMRVFEPIKLAE